MRSPGCRIRWDVEQALGLYLAGVRLKDIAGIVGTSDSAVIGAALRWKWPARAKPAADRPSKTGPSRACLTRRCPGCLAVYKTSRNDSKPHCNSTRFHSIYQDAA